MFCEHCGEALACYEGELYCPECTRYEVEELARQADAETAAFSLALAQAAPAANRPAGDEPPW
jgi:uncharacterized Zn finger protein (UPF0148 family)